MVRDVADRRGAVLDPVAERGATMVDGRGGHARRADFPLDRLGVAEGEVRRELTDLDGRERRGDIAREPVAQRGFRGGGAPDRDVRLPAERRGEEHQALDVIEMEMRKQDVDRLVHPREREAEVADARAGVEDQRAPVRQRQLDARGVPSVAHCLRPGCRNRAPRAPHLDLHAVSPCWLSVHGQKITIAPLEPLVVTIGIALASTSCRTPPAALMRNLP